MNALFSEVVLIGDDLNHHCAFEVHESLFTRENATPKWRPMLFDKLFDNH